MLVGFIKKKLIMKACINSPDCFVGTVYVAFFSKKNYTPLNFFLLIVF